jgi:MFS family permease
MNGSPRAVVAMLGTAQTLAWASTYYLPAILAVPMARELGTSVAGVMAAFSGALVVSALVGPRMGSWIDRWGGRPVLMASNGVFAVGLLLLAWAPSVPVMGLAWLLLGLGMGGGLYESAFATLVRLQGTQARRSITGITLIAGFASTVGWPLSAALEASLGWRGTCAVWAALHLLLGLPMNAMLPRAPARPPAGNDAVPTGREAKGASADPEPLAGPERRRAFVVLAFLFAVTGFVSTALATHLPQLMMAAGSTAAMALWVGGLMGPAQVLARLLEFTGLRHVHPLRLARWATAGHPAGVLLLFIGGPALAPLFGLLHGAGNGMLTLTKGALPLALFGSGGYGARQGLLMAPARLLQAAAPYLVGLSVERFGAATLGLTAALGAAAWAALMLLQPPRPGR